MDSLLVARFESKVDRSGEHHLWTGAHKADGTGMFKVGGGSPTIARKIAWELERGPVPAGARVLILDPPSIPGLTARSQGSAWISWEGGG